ncbi:MAG: hypothetical protein JW909_08345 [Planctomycetes bacterium]|nr:hypothetical protein [Planctomycetota bacterium]
MTARHAAACGVILAAAGLCTGAAPAGETPLPLTEDGKNLPVEVHIPGVEGLISRLEDMLKEGKGDQSAAEELGALYILRGQREAGLRLIGKERVPPLRLIKDTTGRPDAGTGRRPDAGNTGGVDVVDLAAGGKTLAASKDADRKAAGICMLIMSDRPREAEEALKGLPEGLPAHRWLKAMLLARTGRLEKAAEEGRRWSDAVELSSPLKLRHLTFVDPMFPISYGVYQETPGKVLGPGEIAVAYVEVGGYRETKDNNGYTVRFRVDYSIVESTGKTVWKGERPDIESRTTRVATRDLFMTSAFHVPAGLAGGQYTLKYEVQDLVSGEKALGTTPFSVRER